MARAEGPLIGTVLVLASVALSVDGRIPLIGRNELLGLHSAPQFHSAVTELSHTHRHLLQSGVASVDVSSVCNERALTAAGFTGDPPHTCQVPGTATTSQSMKYTFELDTANEVDLEAELEITEGEADLYFDQQDAEGKWTTQKVGDFDAGTEHFFRKAGSIPMGMHAFRVQSTTTSSTFSLTMSTHAGNNRTLNTADFEALKSVASACCVGTCSGAFGQFASDYSIDVCSLEGMHCTSTGRLVHLDVSSTNLACSVTEFQPLVIMDHLTRLNLADNPNLTGSLGDVIPFASTMPLVQLDVSRTQLTGAIPPFCTPPFLKLHSFSAANTKLAGPIPACIFTNIRYLSVRGSSVGGPLPDINPASPLRVLKADADNAGTGKINGDMPSFANLKYLQTLSLANNMIEGELSLPPSVQYVNCNSNMITSIVAPDPEELLTLSLAYNDLSGEVPDDITVAQKLRVLDLSYNSLSSTAPGWDTPLIENIRLDHNKIMGNVPAWLARQPNLLYADISHNELDGTLDAYAAALHGLDNLNTLENLDNKLWVLSLNDNEISGSIPADLSAAGIFVSNPQTNNDGTPITGVINLDNNNLEGEIPKEVLVGAQLQRERGTSIEVSLIGNSVDCPNPKTTGITPEELKRFDCVKEQKDPRGLIAGLVIGVLVLFILIVIGCVIWKVRRRSVQGSGQFSAFGDGHEAIAHPEM